jgi:hypothetical protein
VAIGLDPKRWVEATTSLTQGASTDHWEVNAVVWAKLAGKDALVALSTATQKFERIASDGHDNWPSNASFALDLVRP